MFVIPAQLVPGMTGIIFDCSVIKRIRIIHHGEHGGHGGKKKAWLLLS